MQEFKVNEYITLKLEDGKTNIYVGGELFNQCKYILLKKTVYELEELLKDIESVDELAEYLDHSLEEYEPEEIDIPVETQFWVHCSNMQVWVENEYNINLIHSNLAFPLLKELSKPEINDPLAKKILKNEILKKAKSQDPKTMTYLHKNKYFDLFDKTELKTFFKDSYKWLKEKLSKYANNKKWLKTYFLELIRIHLNLGNHWVKRLVYIEIQSILEIEPGFLNIDSLSYKEKQCLVNKLFRIDKSELLGFGDYCFYCSRGIMPPNFDIENQSKLICFRGYKIPLVEAIFLSEIEIKAGCTFNKSKIDPSYIDGNYDPKFFVKNDKVTEIRNCMHSSTLQMKDIKKDRETPEYIKKLNSYKSLKNYLKQEENKIN